MSHTRIHVLTKKKKLSTDVLRPQRGKALAGVKPSRAQQERGTLGVLHDVLSQRRQGFLPLRPDLVCVSYSVCVCVCVCMRIGRCACVYLYVCTHIHVCVCVCMSMCIHKYMCIHTHTSRHKYIDACAGSHTDTNTCTRARASHLHLHPEFEGLVSLFREIRQRTASQAEAQVPAVRVAVWRRCRCLVSLILCLRIVESRHGAGSPAISKSPGTPVACARQGA